MVLCLATSTHDLQTPVMVKSHLPLGAPISATTLFIDAYQMISVLPDGSLYEAWKLHSRDREEGIDIGTHITICRSSKSWEDAGENRALVTAHVTSVAYCDREQVVFHMKIEGEDINSLLSMPVSHTSIGPIRRFLYQIFTLGQPTPPTLSATQSFKRTPPPVLIGQSALGWRREHSNTTARYRDT